LAHSSLSRSLIISLSERYVIIAIAQNTNEIPIAYDNLKSIEAISAAISASESTNVVYSSA
jgi:hypothetical protein